MNCHECKHSKAIPGDAHLQCDVGWIEYIHALLTLYSNPGNDITIKSKNGEFELEIDKIGIKGGWGFWPLNFDPRWIKRCTRFTPNIDLSAIVVTSIELNGRELIFNPPLELDPFLDEESQQLFVLQDETLGIYVFASTRDELIDELHKDVFFLWDSYANEDPEILTKCAQELRKALRKRISETGNAKEV